MTCNIVAESLVKNILKNLSDSEVTEQHKQVVAGLIIGQHSRSKSFIIHAARCPEKRDDTEEGQGETIAAQEEHQGTIEGLDPAWIAEHAKQVTRLLPGGLDVLGIFVICSNTDFQTSSAQTKFRTILNQVNRVLCRNPLLYQESEYDMIMLAYCPVTQKFTCKTVDVRSTLSSVRPADIKFQDGVTKWQELICDFYLDLVITVSTDGAATALSKQIQQGFTDLADDVRAALALIDGKSRVHTELLDPMANAKGSKTTPPYVDDIKVHCVDLYISEAGNNETASVVDSGALMKIQGKLHGRAYVHQKATVEDGIKMMKKDLVRSLMARCELHCDSLVEETQDTVLIHEPPRRVLASLPLQSVTVSDYLFPGDTSKDTADSLNELLSVDVPEKYVDDSIEEMADERASSECSSSAAETLESIQDMVSSTSIMSGFVQVLLAVAVVVVGIGISYVMLQGSKLSAKL